MTHELPAILDLVNLIFILIILILVFLTFFVIGSLEQVASTTDVTGGSSYGLRLLSCICRVGLVHDVVSEEIKGLITLLRVNTVRFLLCPEIFLLL